MNAEFDADLAASRIAGAIGEPARARMLYSLADGRARTATELAMVSEISPSTASVHLNRLTKEGLVTVVSQGKHRYYRLGGPAVARVLEGLNVLAGGKRRFVPGTPVPLRLARTCYDHIAGALGVAIHDRCVEQKWFDLKADDYSLTAEGRDGFATWGVDTGHASELRRRFAYPCLDWSERRSHLGGALAAALLGVFMGRKWVHQEPGSRALMITSSGRKQFERMGIVL